MKKLTVTISDEAAERLEKAVAGSGHTAEEVAARTLEDHFGRDWYDDLDDEAKAAIGEGLAQADRGEFASDQEVNEVFDRFGR